MPITHPQIPGAGPDVEDTLGQGGPCLGIYDLGSMERRYYAEKKAPQPTPSFPKRRPLIPSFRIQSFIQQTQGLRPRPK